MCSVTSRFTARVDVRLTVGSRTLQILHIFTWFSISPEPDRFLLSDKGGHVCTYEHSKIRFEGQRRKKCTIFFSLFLSSSLLINMWRRSGKEIYANYTRENLVHWTDRLNEREKLRWRSEQCDWKWSFRFRDSFCAVEGLIILISPWSRAPVFDIRESLCVRSSRTSNRIQQFCTLDIVHSLHYRAWIRRER